MTGYDTEYLLAVDWDYETYRSGDTYRSYLGTDYRDEGDATVILEGCDEKYLWGSFSGDLVADFKEGIGYPDYHRIAVKGQFVFMKDWYDL